MSMLFFSSRTAVLGSMLCLALLTSTPARAGVMLEGMGMVKQWVDFEDQLNEMPDNIWGTSDTDGADRIGLAVEFENGLSGSVTYSGVSGLWNTANFPGVAADTSTGFFTSASGLHFLFNTPRTTSYPDALPIAWVSFSMPFSGNFDLDYNNFFGSNFRASTTGWGSGTFTTFSSTAAVNAVPEPTSMICFSALIGLVVVNRRRQTRSQQRTNVSV